MTFPDPNPDTTSSKYHVQISQAPGAVIGDNAQVMQQFYITPTESQVDLTAAEVTYRQQVVDHYKRLNFSGFDTPDLSLANVPLEEVFVRLNLTVEKVTREPMPPENLGHTGQRENQQRERVIKVQEPIELGQALDNHLLIVGEPGAGKSTLLRWLAVTFAEARQREPNRLGPSADADRLPVLVELGHLHDRYLKPEGREPIWHQYLPEYLTDQEAFANTPPQLLTRALDKGRCLLLFDGLDEIADRQVRTRISGSLVKLASQFPDNRVVIGSRPAGVSESEGVLHPLQFHRCQIERFTSADVQRFFHFWYALDRGLTPEHQHEAADALYARVQATPAIMQLATTPLLSTILVLIWRNEGDLPERRVELYERCCRVLIKHWEASHDVHYQSVLADMDWEDDLHLLTPLAHFIHNEEQRTNATREELVCQLAQSLQAEEWYKEQGAAVRAAKQFLDTLGLRSGLLQYIGDNRYGFPHLTFQEYLAARYIAEQPDPKHVDFVMEHLHESWWQEVHLLTIAHLGSGSEKASKASELILTILHVYKPPWWILRSSKNRWLRENGPGKLLPQVQLERRIAWMLDRELALAVRGYAECTPDGTTERVSEEISARAKTLVRRTLKDDARYVTRETLLTIAGQLSHRGNPVVKDILQKYLHDPEWEVQKRAEAIVKQRKEGDEEVVSDLRTTLHDPDGDGRGQTAASLAQVEVSREEVVSGLLADLRDPNGYVRLRAAGWLGYVGMGNKEVVSALLAALRDPDEFVRRRVAESLGQVGGGNEEVVKTLLAFLNDPKGSVQRQVTESLAEIVTGNERGIGILLAALDDPVVKKQDRLQVAEILGKAGNQAGVDTLVAALRDPNRYVRLEAVAYLNKVGLVNQVGVDALVVALHNPDRNVRYQAALSLRQMGVDDEKVTRGLLVALHDPNRDVRHEAALGLVERGVDDEEVTRGLLVALRSPHWHVRDWAALYLGRLKIKKEIQLHRVLVALNGRLHDEESNVRQTALMAIRQLLAGRPIPGYRWVPLRKRRARRQRLTRITFWLGMTAGLVLIGLVTTWLLGTLDPNGFPVRFLAVLTGIVAFIAAVAQVLGRALRDPWEHS